MKRLIFLCFALSLGGCATLERHPVWTAVGTAIIVGSIAASVQHHHDQHVFNSECHALDKDGSGRQNGIIGACVGQ